MREGTGEATVKVEKEEEEKEEKERVTVEGRFLAITSATVSCSCRHTKPGRFCDQIWFLRLEFGSG